MFTRGVVVEKFYPISYLTIKKLTKINNFLAKLFTDHILLKADTDICESRQDQFREME